MFTKDHTNAECNYSNITCIYMIKVTEVVKKEFKVDEAYKIKDGLVKDSYGKFNYNLLVHF